MAKEINLKDLYRVIKKRVWVIGIITFISLILGWIQLSYYTTPLYQTSAKIIVGADEDHMKTLRVIIKDSRVLQEVAKKLNLPISPEALAGKINVVSIDSSQVMSISVIDTDPKRAADIANTTAEVFKDEIPTIINFNDVIPLSPAKVNAWPINEKSTLSYVKYLIIGLILGIGVVFLLDSLDEKMYKESDIEEYLGLPILGNVSKMNKRNSKRKNHIKLNLVMRGGEFFDHK
ncbi:YveK family protein [Falsibacillus pallidus]|uniref:Capsular polysaccharide biosynthesis protein n=1 Tax=Falsibacillus pallidus TaxID=493781 RepID=A0A370GQB4_9BACI|nr:Wzz/FepE/Etk N-terminal domain-containing protein [Falsibacillus pallidus]RDI45701.1 capsular polysaccharide biosynthesis protein [Falsibacillus pallidus]